MSTWLARGHPVARLIGSPKGVGAFIDPQADLRAQFLSDVRAIERARRAARVAGLIESSPAWPMLDHAPYTELRCGARTKRTGKPCPQKSIYLNSRCRWHGGLSTGPRTATGKSRSSINSTLHEPHEPETFSQCSANVPEKFRQSGTLAAAAPVRDSEMLLSQPISIVPRVLDWLARHRWRAYPAEHIADDLALRATELRWVLHRLHRCGLIEIEDLAGGQMAGWRMKRINAGSP